MDAWTEDDTRFLLDLLRINTITPMETGRVCDLERAQRAYAEYAVRWGGEVVCLEPPDGEVLGDPAMPLSVIERASAMGEAFLATQPNLVVRFGAARPVEQTLLLNFHMDTVSGEVAVSLDGGRVTGRGVADAKGLGVGALAAVRLALARTPNALRRISVLVQSVAGEEGGAMGFYGTQYLAQRGYVGRLAIVCEPTSFAWFDRTTTSMTARIEVHGHGSTDDAPTLGQNATIVLAAITDHLVRELSPRVIECGGKICIAGIGTGSSHNRVYGEGQLLVNFAYGSLEVADVVESLVQEAFVHAVCGLRDKYGRYEIARAAAVSAAQICRLTWLKRRLPVLANRDEAMEAVLSRAGLRRHDAASASSPFTCDAMWLQGPGRLAVVFGPGDLGGNGAHAAGEFMEIAEFDRFAQYIASIVEAFAEACQ